MASTSESFASFEQIISRDRFSNTTEVTVGNFKSLIGRYHLSDQVQCQVKTERGLCGQKHNHGYVGLTKDGKEGLIGRHCGVKYFKEHTMFVQERKRIDAEIERRDNITKLRDYKENFLSLSSDHRNIEKKIKEAQKLAGHLYMTLPNVVITFLYQAQKSNNWRVLVDVQRHSRGEKKMTSSWNVETLCTLPPLPSAQVIQSLQGRFDNFNEVFIEACSCQSIEELATPKLNKYIRNISEISDIEASINASLKDTHNFIKDENIINLYYLCANTKEKKDTVRSILMLKGESPTEQLVEKTSKGIEELISRKFGNNQVRRNKIATKYKNNSIGD